MRVFRALLRGFRDLADGSGTAMLDISDNHYPENTKQFKQRWGYWIDAEDYDALMEGKTFAMPEHIRVSVIGVAEKLIDLMKKEGEEDVTGL